jgi:DNA-binding CsgD family transcriptional regulator
VMEAGSFQELGQIMRKSALRLGFSHFAIQLELGSSAEERVGALVTDLPAEMLLPERGMRLFKQLPRFPDDWNNTPLSWSVATDLDIASSTVQPFLAECPQSCGLAVPHYGGGRTKGAFHLISLLDAGQPRRFLTSRVPIATLLSIVMFSAARRLLEQGKLLPAPPALSARERECLSWAAVGKTAWETAQILGITERTANFHLQNVIRKFGVVNKAQALSVAMASGLL